MFTESDREKLEYVFSFIEMMRRMACERGDFYSVADNFRKRINNFEHDMIVRTDEIKDITHKERIELERTIRPDLDCIKKKIGAGTDVNGDAKDAGDSDAKYGFMLINILKLAKMVVDLDKRMEGVADILGKIASRCGEGKDADDDCKKNPSMSAIIDTSIDVCRLEERIESINGKLDRFMRMFKEGVADAVNETSDKPKRRPGRRRKDA